MPYTVGLQAAVVTLLSAGFPTIFTTGIIIIFFILSMSSYIRWQKDGLSAPASLPGHSIFAIVPFYRQRHDFLNWGFQATGHPVFQFSLLGNTVVVVSGESARRMFFSAKSLDLTEGFKILSGAIPMVRGVTSDLQTKRVSLIHKRLASVQQNGHLSALVPVILADCQRMMESWGTSGVLDPFERVYELVFQITVRALSCSEISDDPALVLRLKNLYHKLDTGTTPATILIPWLPTPAMLQKLWATKDIYNIVTAAIDARETTGIPRNDTLQMLLDNKDEKLVVAGFIMGLLIAGARATGTTACWITTFLGGHPEWRAKAKAEVELLVELASLPVGKGNSAISSRLATLSLETFELQTPVLDSIIRETLRIAQPHTAMRRNLGPEMFIDGKLIPQDAYVVYPFSDVHLDPEVYPDPWKFNPARPVAPDVKSNYNYLGWGGGKTVCLGQRLGKIELKLITAMFLLGFEHHVVDGFGKPADPLPTPNWNDIFFCRPPPSSFSLKYKRTKVTL